MTYAHAQYDLNSTKRMQVEETKSSLFLLNIMTDEIQVCFSPFHVCWSKVCVCVLHPLMLVSLYTLHYAETSYYTTLHYADTSYYTTLHYADTSY